jgi:Asp-tRNA(Asn)/Glu-tRNA(Gln) amidotransferase A subunit family amidase
MNDIFKKYSFLLGITNPYGIPSVEELKGKQDLLFHATKLHDHSTNYLLLANFAGLPSISIPFSQSPQDQMPLGLVIDGPVFADQEVLNFAFTLEKILTNGNHKP